MYRCLHRTFRPYSGAPLNVEFLLIAAISFRVQRFVLRAWVPRSVEIELLGHIAGTVGAAASGLGCGRKKQ